MRKTAALVIILCLLAPALAQETRPAATTSQPASEKPYWLEPMKKLHADFKGDKDYVAQFGDSITYSMAFWSVLSWSDPSGYLPDDALPKAPTGTKWQDVVKGARDKGPASANYSGWRVGDLLQAVPKVLQEKKPAVAIIMIGTNDVSGGKVPTGYEDGLEKVIKMCLDAKCVPILNTIPPRRGHAEAVQEANRIIRKLAEAAKVPLVDYCAEIMKRRAEDWDGTLIGNDGVHPSAGKTNDFSEANLKECGYALRTWLNFLAYRQVYFHILAPVQK